MKEPVAWTHDDQVWSREEGWGLFTTSDGLKIQRVDEVNAFKTDADAVYWVKSRAAAPTSKRARLALEWVQWEAEQKRVIATREALAAARTYFALIRHNSGDKYAIDMASNALATINDKLTTEI